MKKLLALMLGICLIIPCSFIFTGCKEEKAPKMENWDGSTIEVSAEENGVITIDTAEELAGLAKEVNNGNSFEGKTIKLACDMDMLGRTWTPIGLGHRSDIVNAKVFSGTFDGNGKKILGLSSEGYDPVEGIKRLESDFQPYSVYTHNYGLFGMTENATIKNLTVTVDFECDEELLKGDAVGGIVGYAHGGLVIENCVVNGEIEGYDGIGGVVGRAYYSTTENSVVIKNSTNNAEVEALCKAAGIVGYLGKGSIDATIDRCVNNGEIFGEGFAQPSKSKVSMVSGIINYGWTNSLINKMVVTNNVNKGSIHATEELSDVTTNHNAYAYIALSSSEDFNAEKHSYDFSANSNTGKIFYLNEEMSDAVNVTLYRLYTPYEATAEFNNQTYVAE